MVVVGGIQMMRGIRVVRGTYPEGEVTERVPSKVVCAKRGWGVP